MYQPCSFEFGSIGDHVAHNALRFPTHAISFLRAACYANARFEIAGVCNSIGGTMTVIITVYRTTDGEVLRAPAQRCRTAGIVSELTRLPTLGQKYRLPIRRLWNLHRLKHGQPWLSCLRKGSMSIDTSWLQMSRDVVGMPRLSVSSANVM